MNKTLPLLKVIIWVLLLSSDTAAQLLFKVAALNFSGGVWLSNYPFFLAYVFELLSFLLWMRIIKDTRLSIALALTAILYITVSLTSYIFFHEQINILQWIGTVLIAAGTCLLGYYEGTKAVSEA
ncbi:EamA family transporter [Legionella cherrii]|uniref:4-amino-4-deoxy-L-arabinose-phosphoundecaprenol flippase subunit ArnE n=1 Tax=Legionella cherrii TaxID=28084 RepID=A0A0W0S917_9GAMM|nr:EamA family transporter [Legionella cherrii]KTC79808.1 4-amino-4-deoxy-L-arabinose-phosphoundecaprenol flippase subunit ArnE [Legionella cherrii]VEB38024.1 EamA-like transporter family [Legionella cherrii]